MHVLGRIKPSEDNWKKVTLLSLQQLVDDMRVNEKRVSALEKCILTLGDLLVASNGEARQDMSSVTAALHDVHEEIEGWSKQSLDRAEQLAVAVRQLASDQDIGPLFAHADTKERLAG